MIYPNKFAKLLEDELDFDFRADSERIETLEEFEQNIFRPFYEKEQIFYRGERKCSITRPLLPSIFRDKEYFFDSSASIAVINNKTLYDFYCRNEEYVDLYERIIGRIDVDKMYPFLAFSQHYFGISPLIDFTKSPYVALSFALKDRKEYKEDILLYTLQLKSKEDYTDDIETANQWIKNYNVMLFRDIDKRRDMKFSAETVNEIKFLAEKIHNRSLLDINTPDAKLIDVPANDLLRYQQGVFLLLDSFSLVGKQYLTKKIRDDFYLKKWIINKDICPSLLDRLLCERPYYAFRHITDLSSVVSEIRKKYEND